MKIAPLKDSKNLNDFMTTSVLPKTNQIIVRISLILGRNDVSIKLFQFLLTFMDPITEMVVAYVFEHGQYGHLPAIIGQNQRS